MKLIKNFACYVSVFAMAFAPFAEAKGKELQQREKLNEYLKYTGLSTNKNLTVKEYWNSVRHVYPKHLQTQMDAWVQLNGNQKVPTVQATNFKDAEGNEQIRLILSTADGQTLSLNYTGNEEVPLKINNVGLTKNDINYSDLETLADRLTAKDASLKKAYDAPVKGGNVVLTYKQYKKLSPEKQVEYFLDIRQAMEAAVKVHEVFRGKSAVYDINNRHQWVREFFFGESVYAGEDSDVGVLPEGNGGNSPGGGQSRCVVAGYISLIAEDGSCGGIKSGGDNLRAQARAKGPFQASCPGADTPCNPLVYGFDSGGNPHCAPRAEIIAATSICSNSKSPLSSGEDKVRIVNSILKKKNSKLQITLDENGKVLSAKGQVLSEKQWREVQTYLGELNGYIDQAEDHCANPDVNRRDQQDACENLITRRIQLERAGENAAGGKVVGAKATGACNWLCRNKKWLIPVGAIVGVGLLWWLVSGKKKKKSTPPVVGPTPPVVVPPVTPKPTPTPTAPPTEGGARPGDDDAGGVRLRQNRGGQ